MEVLNTNRQLSCVSGQAPQRGITYSQTEQTARQIWENFTFQITSSHAPKTREFNEAWDRIPTEIWFAIFDCLNPKTLNMLAQTSRSVRSCLHDYELQKCKFALAQHFGNHPLSMPNGLLTSNGWQIFWDSEAGKRWHPNALNLTDCFFNPSNLAKLPPSVNTLQLSNSSSIFHSIASFPQTVVNLDLSNCELSVDIMETIPLSIEILNLSGCELSVHIMQTIPESVETLSLSGCQLSVHIMQTIPESVETLNLSGCVLSKAVVEATPESVQILNLSGCVLSNEIVQSIPQSVLVVRLLNYMPPANNVMQALFQLGKRIQWN